MIYDFSRFCKTYNKDIYKIIGYFKRTPCPACNAVGKFKPYGSYKRYALYFEGGKVVCSLMVIKRVMCTSCGTTHAVMPGDIIPYKAITLFVLIYILVSFYLKKDPVQKISTTLSFSVQYIYSCLKKFILHIKRIHQYFREVSPADTPPEAETKSVVGLIKAPYIKFQNGYVKVNHRPCFMCKFFDGEGAPPVGLFAP